MKKAFFSLSVVLIFAIAITVHAENGDGIVPGVSDIQFLPFDTEKAYEFTSQGNPRMEEIFLLPVRMDIQNLEKDTREVAEEIIKYPSFTIGIGKTENPQENVFYGIFNMSEQYFNQSYIPSLTKEKGMQKIQEEPFPYETLFVANNGITYLFYEGKVIVSNNRENAQRAVEIMYQNELKVTDLDGYKNIAEKRVPNSFFRAYQRPTYETVQETAVSKTSEGLDFSIVTQSPTKPPNTGNFLQQLYAFVPGNQEANDLLNPIVSKLNGQSDPEIAGPGYINFNGIKNYLKPILEAEKKDILNPGILDILSDLLAPWEYATFHTNNEQTSDGKNLQWTRGSIQVNLNYFGLYGENFYLLEEKYPILPNVYAETVPCTGNAWSPYYNKSITFCDVQKNDWFEPEISSLASIGVLSGYPNGCFSPEKSITRAEFIKIVLEYIGSPFARIAGAREPLPENPFSDVSENDWFYTNIREAIGLKLINGYSDGTFRPNAPITRAEAVNVLYHVFKDEQDNDYAPKSDTSLFNDVSSSDWFFSPIYWAKEEGIVSGTTPATFEPNRNINRAEAAIVVSHMSKYSGCTI